MFNLSKIEQHAFEKLSTEGFLYPLQVTNLERNVEGNSFAGKRQIADYLIKLSYKNKSADFLVELKSRSVPQVIEQGISQVKNLLNGFTKKYYPLLLVPNLSKSLVELLEKYNVSGIDLNGNYYILSDEIIAIRLDQKNRYKETVPIKNIYLGNSSIVPRFLLRKKKIFSSVNEIYDEIKKSGGDISLSTISKVLKSLTGEFIIQKNNSGISLIQPQKLLQNLQKNYQPPAPLKILRLKLPQDRNNTKEILNKYLGNDWIWSGETSADIYASTTIAKEATVYARSISNDEEFIKNFVDVKFYNCTLLIISEAQNYLFYDSQNKYSSKVQSYIELMQLGKREKEIAVDIEKLILNEFE
jgi:hypothetical protein